MVTHGMSTIGIDDLYVGASTSAYANFGIGQYNIKSSSMREVDNAYTEYIPDAEPDDANDPIADSFGPNIPSDSEPDEVEHPIPNDNEDDVHPHARVLTILHHMGFYGMYRCGRFIADFHLITALVERWRRETHTFHFRVGEATITLQDIAVIWDFPIDGRPVTGVNHEMSIPQWMQYCEVTLGFHPEPEHFRGAHLYTTALAQHMRQHLVTDDSDEEHVYQYARTCAFMLFGGVMYPDSSGNSIPLLYLPKFKNVDELSGYSWGSTVLVFLYCELCTACSKIKCNIGGALQLLQPAASSSSIPCPFPSFQPPPTSYINKYQSPTYPHHSTQRHTLKTISLLLLLLPPPPSPPPAAPLSAFPSDDNPTLIWVKTKGPHDHSLSEIKEKCRTMLGFSGVKHKRHSSVEFRYDPLIHGVFLFFPFFSSLFFFFFLFRMVTKI
ncbi:hypothetical protein Pfo_003483 [Paulownia fortunei]|nr:hypothetical protein Pfo_003483 [Paulownia fortunei]